MPTHKHHSNGVGEFKPRSPEVAEDDAAATKQALRGIRKRDKRSKRRRGASSKSPGSSRSSRSSKSKSPSKLGRRHLPRTRRKHIVKSELGDEHVGRGLSERRRGGSRRSRSRSGSRSSGRSGSERQKRMEKKTSKADVPSSPLRGLSRRSVNHNDDASLLRRRHIGHHLKP
jgi:transcription factor SPN1